MLGRMCCALPVRWLVGVGLVSAFVAGCPPPADEGGGGEGEGEGEGEGDAAPFTVLATTTLDDAVPLGVSGVAITARPDGRFAVAWFEDGDQTVLCDLASGPVDGPTYVLKLADERPDGTVRVRVVDDAVPTNREDSVDLAVATDGAILIAYNGGEPTRTFCGASDLILAVEDDEDGTTFTRRTVAADAGTSSTCRGAAGGDPYCAQGSVVGLFPGLSVDASGALALTYMDTHFGFGDTDVFSSDAELATGTATTTTTRSVNMESGAGQYGSCALAPDGRVLVGHMVVGGNVFGDGAGDTYVVEDGIYAEVVGADGVVAGGIDPPPLLDGARTASRVATAFAPARGFLLAVHLAVDEDLRLFETADDGATWTSRFVEQLGRSGRDPGIVVLDDGRLVLAYGHCRDDTDRDTCDARRDGVRLAVEAGDRFVKQTLPGDAEDLEGIGVDVAPSGPAEVVVVDLNTSQNRLTVRRVRVNGP
jgi:hypothetical protein